MPLDNLVRLQFAHAQSFPHDLVAIIRDRMAAGQHSFPLIGTLQQVVDGILALAATG
jgi:dimethylsulfone monooxygenase